MEQAGRSFGLAGGWHSDLLFTRPRLRRPHRLLLVQPDQQQLHAGRDHRGFHKLLYFHVCSHHHFCNHGWVFLLDFGPGQLKCFKVILSYKAGVYELTVSQSPLLISGMTAHVAMPGWLEHSILSFLLHAFDPIEWWVKYSFVSESLKLWTQFMSPLL